jgi:hypothetical protein
MKKKWKKVDKGKLIEGRLGDQRVPMNANVDGMTKAGICFEKCKEVQFYFYNHNTSLSI